MTVSRRETLGFLAALGALTGAPALSQDSETASDFGLDLGAPGPFGPDTVKDLARSLATQPYKAPPKVPQDWLDLTYDQYKSIWFDTRNALWRDTDKPLRLEFFPAGLYFPSPIHVHAVENGQAREVLFNWEAFDKTDKVPEMPITEAVGYSGFRLHGELLGPGNWQEYAVFQGASYFRAVGSGMFYGLSARGLSLNTGEPQGEEFPDFRQFWVETPAEGQGHTIIHALMDSPSVTGAYRFQIAKGETTLMKIDATLFPRTDLYHVGIAPGTSMFFFDETNRHRFDDFRPVVHDSDGLLIENGAGEILWRPLANPSTLQTSFFVDENPRGFGLIQRERDLHDFADLEAHYHQRPSLWVEPLGDWGKGAVQLVEIPTDREIYDNIVAYWRPEAPLATGGEYDFSYRLYWCWEPPLHKDVSKVLNTRMGSRWYGDRVVTVDFAPHTMLPLDPEEVTIHISANTGEISSGILQRNPETGGLRLGFSYDPGEATAMEMRAQLLVGDKPVTEVWLYRWTA